MILRAFAAASVAILVAVAGTALAQDASISVKDRR